MQGLLKYHLLALTINKILWLGLLVLFFESDFYPLFPVLISVPLKMAPAAIPTARLQNQAVQGKAI